MLVDTWGYRDSSIYPAINVRANSYAVVTRLRSPVDPFTTAAILRYVKKHKAWKPTKVLVMFIDVVGWAGPFPGSSYRWARTDVLDQLVLIDREDA